MFEPLQALLHAIEGAIPAGIRADANFAGLRLDRTGTELRIALFVPDARPPLVDRLLDAPEFRALLHAHRLRVGAEHGVLRLLGCSAGDQGYAPERNYVHFGTFGWIVCLDGFPACLGSYHVFCPAGDDSARGREPVFWRDRDARQLPRRVGTLYDFVPMAKADPRRFDLAAVRLDDVGVIANLWSDWKTRSGHAYPLALAPIDRTGDDERYYVVGAGMLQDRVELVFRGIGTRKDPVNGYYFRDQLFFAPVDAEYRLVGGDSGAVVVHDRSNAVVGMAMMTSSGLTVANPLCQMPWRPARNATVVLGGVRLPAFSTRS
jgi:hypothetical protein